MKRPFKTADGKSFETRERAFLYLCSVHREVRWKDFIYVGTQPRWRVFANGAMEDM